MPLQGVRSWQAIAGTLMRSSCFLNRILLQGRLHTVNVRDSLGALQFLRHEANTYLSHYCQPINLILWMARAHRRCRYKRPLGGRGDHSFLNSQEHHVINKK